VNLKNKKVLITGADGFIGSHLTEALLESAASVRAFVYYNSFNSLGWLDSLPSPALEGIDICTGDIRDPHRVRAVMDGVDVVLHLAALVAIPFSYQSPDSYVDTNIRGTLNVLQACRAVGVERAVMTSTSEVYGTAQYIPIDEKHPLQGQSPYSATKIAADRMAEAFHCSYDLPVTIVRPFNTYGPRQSARAIIPTIITQLLAGTETIRLGNVAPTRDFCHVKDTCAGFLAVLQRACTVGEELNIASGREISIGDLAQKLIDLINPQARIESEQVRMRPSKSEVHRLVGCTKKIRAMTDWEPRYSLDDGLVETIEWLKGNMQRYQANVYNV